MELLQGEAFDNLFRTFDRSAFHLELQDSYHTPEEAGPFDLFLAGKPDDFAWHQPWLALVREATRKGKTITRARVVTVPHVDYTRDSAMRCSQVADTAALASRRTSNVHKRELGFPRPTPRKSARLSVSSRRGRSPTATTSRRGGIVGGHLRHLRPSRPFLVARNRDPRRDIDEVTNHLRAVRVRGGDNRGAVCNSGIGVVDHD